MGNRSSAPNSTENEQDGGSGMYLTQEVRGKINEDFENHLLQSEWNKYRMAVLQRYRERQNQEQLREAEIQQQLKAFQVQSKMVHQSLDEKVDTLKSRIVDLEVEVGHDVDRLSKKFEGDLPKSEQKCLETRAELSHCYNTLKDGRACQVYLEKLEKCVTATLSASI